ncbi:MAG: hypothetical protein ACI9BO_001992 [Zhongshania sp.]|jgi:hypothetical protein
MTASNELRLDRLPNTLPMLLKAAITRKTPGKNPLFPDHSLVVSNLSTDMKTLKRYQACCNFEQSSYILPASYLHIQAFRLQMKLMLDKNFPVAPMGCVHLSNTISQHREVKTDEKLRMSCQISEHKLSDKGVEFSFHCAAHVGDELVWEDVSLYLSRCKTGIAAPAKAPRGPAREYAESQPLSIARSDARGYARASGDLNPIHLHDISAKALGFKRMVIHGMWSKAACLAALSAQIKTPSYRCHVEFKTPIFLPSKVQLLHESTELGLDFELRNESGVKPHLIGQVTYL